MPVPSTISDISDNASINSPAGTDQIAGTLDDYLRAIQAILKKQFITGGSIAAAATLPVPAAGAFLDVTGAATIQQISNSFDGRCVILRFAAGSTLQHSAALIMPGSASITTQANDAGVFVQTGAGTWTCAAFSRTLNTDMVDGYHAGNSSGQVAVSNGTVCTNLNADLLDGYHAGNASGQVAASNGTVCTNLNADLLDGYHAAALLAWGNQTGKPTTLEGYGITDALPLTGGTLTGDLATYRSATPTTGVIFLGNSGTRYLYYDGTNYNMPGANLILNGSQAVVANWGSWNIGINGSAAQVGGYAASALWRNDAVSFNNAATGYFQFPPDASGRRLLVQWAPLPTVGGSVNITFPMNFPNAILGVNVSVNSNTDDATLFCLFARKCSISGFQVYTRGIACLGGSYLAWGY